MANMLIYFDNQTGVVDRAYWIESMFQDIIKNNSAIDSTHGHLIATAVSNPSDLFSKFALHVDPQTNQITQIPNS